MSTIPPLLKRKYPKAKYAPRRGCQYCKGVGQVNGAAGWKPCVCIFVRHDQIETMLKVLPDAWLESVGLDTEALKGQAE